MDALAVYSWPALKPLTVVQAWRAVVAMIRGPARPDTKPPGDTRPNGVTER